MPAAPARFGVPQMPKAQAFDQKPLGYRSTAVAPVPLAAPSITPVPNVLTGASPFVAEVSVCLFGPEILVAEGVTVGVDAGFARTPVGLATLVLPAVLLTLFTAGVVFLVLIGHSLHLAGKGCNRGDVSRGARPSVQAAKRAASGVCQGT